jgi:histidinol-phosphate/aromatic aminotransferase/cobyric acid decarboxylase-like protein
LTALDEAARGPGKTIDFQTIANPLGPSEAVRRALASFDPKTPPDPEWTALREALALRLGLDAAQVWAGEGLMEAVVRALGRPGHRAVVFTPASESYVDAVLRAGGEAVEWRAQRQRGVWRWDLRELHASWKGLRATCTVLGNPNDPTGAAIGPQEVRRLAQAVAPAPLVVDERCLPFVDGAAESLPLIADQPNVVVLRSLQRAYGLGSLAVEHVAASPETVSKVRAAMTSKPASTTAAAQTAGLAALEDGERHLREGMTIAREGAKVLAQACQDLGLRVESSPRASYLLVRLPGRLPAAEVRAALLERGYDVMDCTPMGLPHHIRLAARMPRMCRGLAQALGEVVGGETTPRNL